MIHLKEYYNYDDEINKICRKYKIINWSIRDGLVDVDDYIVEIIGNPLTKSPLNFGRVSGDFYFSYTNINTFEGMPEWVGGDFTSTNNKITTLKGGPKYVGGEYDVSRNKDLETLEGSPQIIFGDFKCSDTKIKNFKGGPKIINGKLICEDTLLETLEEFPEVKGDIYIRYNELPKEIKDNMKYFKKIVKYQDEYDIWRDGKLYLPRFQDLMIDIKEGL